ncbi:protein ACCELERATED CELL DEATH 6-like [Solanum stenotomum]|uniref:protein ACCELERATED CELL DEATH 6-like n=1 Tax=Solanum stenotomum TaxID=172797 RepID=UPI0020CFF95F|nr:protein ACCELERATED CELL DEATH 6-like [Solanum stenotomum]
MDILFHDACNIITEKLVIVVLPMISVTRRMVVVVPEWTESVGTHEYRAWRDERLVKDIMNATQMHLVVATLIMTATCTVGFTLPGGTESDTNSPNKGMAILLRRITFRTFVVSDVIALTFSDAAVFAYFYIATITIVSSVPELQVIDQLYNNATMLQLLSIAAGLVAFATGMYATLAHSVGLAVTICVINVISYYLVCFMILLPKTRPSENRLNRSIV